MTTATSPTSATSTGNIAAREYGNLERWGTYSRLFCGERRFTNVEELAHAGRLASVLKEVGVQPGDRVVTLLPNSAELTFLYQAVWLVGGVMTPIMPHWTASEIAPVLRNAEPSAIVTIPPIAVRVLPMLAGLDSRPELLVFGAAADGSARELGEMTRSAEVIQTPADRSALDIALLLYTSGTTGAPKGATLTHGNLHAALDAALRLNPALARGAVLHMLPLAHSFGLLMLNLSHAWGCTSVLLQQFDPAQAFQLIEKHRVLYTGVVPTMMVYLMNHPARVQHDLSSLARVTSGGAPLAEQVRSDFIRVFNCRVDQGYGLSETMAVVSGYAEQDSYRPGSAGRPAPGVEVRVEKGEICVGGEHVMRGYWRDEETTQAVLSGSWLRTGDIGYVDDDGFVYITDRKKDLIIKGGENISPREIEEALYLHPAVAEACVVGMPDAVFGEEIWAVLQLKLGAETNDQSIRQHVARYVTKFKVPARVVFQPALPKNSNGKILKREVRAQLLARAAGR